MPFLKARYLMTLPAAEHSVKDVDSIHQVMQFYSQGGLFKNKIRPSHSVLILDSIHISMFSKFLLQ